MKIFIGSDHAGWQAKQVLSQFLREQNHQVTDCGADSEESCDYPDYALQVAQAVGQGQAERGLLICGTGIGMAITANKVAGVRAALCTNEQMATLSRNHNNSNVLCLGSRILSSTEMEQITTVWLASDFQGGRHQRRIDKISAAEK